MIGHGLLLGQPLYSYLWDQKPPAIYITYAIGELIFGFGNNAIYGITVVGTIVTLIAIYFAGARYAGGQITGLVAAAFWVLLSQSLDLQANQPNSELFMNCCLFGIFAILTNTNRLNNKTVILTGLLAALATQFKQITLSPISLLLAARLILSDSQNRKRCFIEATIILLIVALSWFFIATWFLEANSFTDFYEAVFTYNISYSQIGRSDISHLLKAYWNCLAQGIPLDRYVQGFLEIAGTVGIAKIISRDQFSKLWLYWLVYLVGTLIAIAIARHPFAHYFQLLIPFAAVGGAWSLNSLQNSLSIGLKTLFSYYNKSLTSFHLISMHICLTLMFFGPLFSDRVRELCASPDDWSFRKYTNWFIADKAMGEKLKSILYPFDTLYVMGDASTLYFYSGHFPAACTF
jgi:4-amino-4-deoxy-L-arabinose transferase-like glycosyltransferase